MTTEEFRVYIKQIFNNSVDIYCLKQKVCGVDIIITKIDNITSDVQLSLMLLARLSELGDSKKGDMTGKELHEYIQSDTSIPMSQITATSLKDIKKLLIMGFALIYVEGQETLLGVGIQALPGANVGEVSTEGNIKGSRLGFSQNLRTNMGLMRQIVRTNDLVFKTAEFEGANRVEYMICYHNAHCPKELLEHVESRLKSIHLPMIFDSVYLAGFMQKNRFSLFSTSGTTERPVTAAAKICEGKVLVFVAGSPFALVYPYFFSENFVSLDDYASRPYFASFVRLLKYFSFLLAVLLPALFVSVTNFTPELFSGDMLHKLAFAEQGTPLPLFAEAIAVTLLFEVVREAGLRLPKQIGGSVSLVSALIVGDAAIKLGLVSSPIIIVVALASLAAFVVPSLYEPVVSLRIIFLFAVGLGGPVLLLCVFLIVLLNLSAVKSFGIPIRTPILPTGSDAVKDGFLRASQVQKSEEENEFDISQYVTREQNAKTN